MCCCKRATPASITPSPTLRAGGFQLRRIGEMGEEAPARPSISTGLPLKYAGLSYTEIWISESQERMILAVPPDRWDALERLCKSEDVEATVLGTFEETGRLQLFYQEANRSRTWQMPFPS